MRDTMFRGKRTEYGEWVHGYLIGDDVIVGNIVEFNDEYFNTSFWYKVRPETVGQYTGLKDKNGKEIYEGDIFKRENCWPVYSVVFEEGCFMLGIHGMLYPMHTREMQGEMSEILGNIYENPELLEGGQA